MFHSRSHMMWTVFVLSSFVTTIWGGEVMAAQLILRWTDTSRNEKGFKIERKTGATGTFAQIATAGVNNTKYTDTTVTGGKNYCYRVRAYNSAGNSAYTNSVCRTAPTITSSAVVSLTLINADTGQPIAGFNPLL